MPTCLWSPLCRCSSKYKKRPLCSAARAKSTPLSVTSKFLLARPPQPSPPLTYHAVVSLSATVVHHIINVIGGSKLGCGNRIHEAPRVANSSLPRCCIRYCDTLSPTPTLSYALRPPHPLFPRPPHPLSHLPFTISLRRHRRHHYLAHLERSLRPFDDSPTWKNGASRSRVRLLPSLG